MFLKVLLGSYVSDLAWFYGGFGNNYKFHWECHHHSYFANIKEKNEYHSKCTDCEIFDLELQCLEQTSDLSFALWFSFAFAIDT